GCLTAIKSCVAHFIVSLGIKHLFFGYLFGILEGGLLVVPDLLDTLLVGLLLFGDIIGVSTEFFEFGLVHLFIYCFTNGFETSFHRCADETEGFTSSGRISFSVEL